MSRVANGNNSRKSATTHAKCTTFILDFVAVRNAAIIRHTLGTFLGEVVSPVDFKYGDFRAKGVERGNVESVGVGALPEHDLHSSSTHFVER
jgi:hypothetical protein